MSNNISFAGWQPGKPEWIISWKEKFDEIYNSEGQLTLLSKEEFETEADEDLPSFKYRYIVKAIDMQAFGTDRKSIAIQLLMCPSMRYWNENILRNVMNDMDESWFHEDAADSGILPKMGEEYLDYTDNDVPPDEYGNKWDDYFYNIFDYSKANEVLDVISTVLVPIDQTRGFSLGQIWNKLGNTGWDLLEYILNGENYLDAALERYKESILQQNSEINVCTVKH